MSRKSPRVIHPLSQSEFVILMALMTSLIALAIDGMLPALPAIARDLNVLVANETQHIVTALFLGFGVGQLIYGPLSDSYGRKAPIYWGILIFVLGCLVSAFATDLNMMLFGRVLQGFGAAGPRIVAIALVRDEYEGNAMARIMSLVMTVFVVVPAIAPSLGKVVLVFSTWRAIFAVLLVLAVIILFWFGIRQPETLPSEKRKPFSLKQIGYGLRETLLSRQAVLCMIVSGLVFGAFMGYLTSCYQIFELFGEGERFHLYFGSLALSLGLASFSNSAMVMRLGMLRLVLMALIATVILSTSFFTYLALTGFSQPPLWLFMLYMMVSFFFIGILFGNLNAMAMQPLGHVAGIGSAIVGSLQSVISIALGVSIGQMFNGTINPVIGGFALLSMVSFLVIYFGLKEQEVTDTPSVEDGMSEIPL